MKQVFVTGANSGIGKALAGRLSTEYDCHIYMGCRDLSKGQQAKDALENHLPKSIGRLELIQIDVSNIDSVEAAAKALETKLNGENLYAIVNNAGTGGAHGNPVSTIININLNGVKRVTDAFTHLVQDSGRIVNLGSGNGPRFVKDNLKEDSGDYDMMTAGKPDWSWIEAFAKKIVDYKDESIDYYGLSKACLHKYTELVAREHSNLVVSSCSPGFIVTAMTEGKGATKTPEEGCVSLIHCLFDQLSGSGYYYGSDGIRSPLHFMRNPGEPVFTGY